jgi:hypothetical protein
MKLQLLKLVLFLFFISAPPCFGQDRQYSSGREKENRELPDRFKGLEKKELKNKVVINNNTGFNIKFSTGVDNVNWEAASIQNGYMLTYTTKGFYIKLQTGIKEVKYYLKSGYSYSITLNKDKNIWDIFLDP